ncbi:Serine/threonine protein kinase [Phaffia rhodozyma]|uniref:Serine/threonine protein kinase n=1 Tax=Phaffia rhodozyma TaxID=264483 RepID=A0A0F7SGL0_PHARH|nr:Serine/threonine protein kinase [Phaffia rhodozyma]
MSARPAASSTADQHPGAGYARLALSSPPDVTDAVPTPPLTPPGHRPMGSSTWAGLDWKSICDQLCQEPYHHVVSPDRLLPDGLGDYTVVPGGLLGKGKFSVVYRAEKAGKQYAIKHTPLHPHHPLIATRLLREPTLLAQLPPHPNLIRVFETIKTDGHFYLVEEYLPSHVSLDALCATYPSDRLPTELCWKIFEQLISVVREGMHAHHVCHRDIKPENVLIDPSTGLITLIDLGLATHFSTSSPKLTTCCGSPAFHSPEIVLALSRPPGEVTYWGPELDIWCVALTVLRCWTGRRYPLGTGHKNLTTMHGRAQDLFGWIRSALMTPAQPDGTLGKRSEERKLRDWLSSFLDIDSHRRQAAFNGFEFGSEMKARLDGFQRERGFKQCIFHHCPVKHTLPLTLIPDGPSHSEHSPIPPKSNRPPRSSTLVIRHPPDQSSAKTISYFKYALRCSSILYHSRSVSSRTLLSSPLPPTQTSSSPSSLNPVSSIENLAGSTEPDLDILQCVAVLPAEAGSEPQQRPEPEITKFGVKRPFLPSLFRSNSSRQPSTALARSSSTPVTSREPIRDPKKDASKTTNSPQYLVFLMAFSFSDPELTDISSSSGVARKRRKQSRSRTTGGGSKTRSESRGTTGEWPSRQNSVTPDGSRTRTRTRTRTRSGSEDKNLSTSASAELEFGLPRQDHPSWWRRHSAITHTSPGSGSMPSTPDPTPPLSPAVEGTSTSFFPVVNAKGQSSQRKLANAHSRASSRVRSTRQSTLSSRESSVSRSRQRAPPDFIPSAVHTQAQIRAHSRSPFKLQIPPVRPPSPPLRSSTGSYVTIYVSDPRAIPLIKSAIKFEIAPPGSPDRAPLGSADHSTQATLSTSSSSSTSSSLDNFARKRYQPRSRSNGTLGKTRPTVDLDRHRHNGDDNETDSGDDERELDDEGDDDYPRGRSEARNYDSYPSTDEQPVDISPRTKTGTRTRTKTKKYASTETTPRGDRTPVNGSTEATTDNDLVPKIDRRVSSAPSTATMATTTTATTSSDDYDDLLPSPDIPAQGQPLFPFNFRVGATIGGRHRGNARREASSSTSSSGPDSTSVSASGDTQSGQGSSGFGGLFETMSLGLKGLGEAAAAAAVVSVRAVGGGGGRDVEGGGGGGKGGKKTEESKLTRGNPFERSRSLGPYYDR